MFSRGRKAVERFFSNCCNVSSLEKIRTDWGETREVQKVILKDVPCRMVNRRETFKDNSIFTTDTQNFTLLFSKDVSIEKGNKLDLFLNGDFIGNYVVIGNSFEYSTHREILIQEEV